MFYRNSSIIRSKRFIIVGKSGRSVSLPPSLTSGITFDGANRSVLINREAVLAELRRRLPPIRLSLSRAQGALINANTWNTTTYRRLFAFLPPGGSFFAGVPARSLYRGSASDGRNRGFRDPHIKWKKTGTIPGRIGDSWNAGEEDEDEG